MKRIYDYNAELYKNYGITDAVKVGVATTLLDIVTRCFFREDGAVTIIAEDLNTGALYRANSKFTNLKTALNESKYFLESISMATNWVQVVWFINTIV